MTKKFSFSEKQIRQHLLTKVDELRNSNSGSFDKKVAIATARDILVVDELSDRLKKIFPRGWANPKKPSKSNKPFKRVLSGFLGDLHFGSHINSEECPIEYNSLQESRRIGAVIEEIADYKTQYRDNTKLIVHLLGDIIQGFIHDPRDGEPLAVQFSAAVYYLTQAVLFLSSEFRQIDVYCATGNHGRNIARHKERAVSQKYDSIETMIYYAVKMAVLNAGVTNCKFVIPKTPYYIADIFDWKLFGTHGDTVLNPGNPGKSINVSNLAFQVSKWNAARNVGGPFQIFVCGHIHTGAIISLPGNVTMITNGCLVPPDSYALSIGNADNTCGQWIVESTEKYAVGDVRFVLVDGAEKRPNNIVKEYKGF